LAVITEPGKTFSRMFRGYDPAALESAYQEQKNPPEASVEARRAEPVDQKVSTG
jgi:hypothetical protein